MTTPHPHAGPAGRTGAPATLLDQVSPYGSRKITVECDDAVTAMYLHTPAAVRAATWVANHCPAPDRFDQSRIDAGLTPVMPADHTKHPAGRPRLDPAQLEVLWFAEGDGAALLERGQPVAVIAGWSDADRGLPGYSAEAVGWTPFAGSLSEAASGLTPALDRAARHWRWLRGGGWDRFRGSILTHLEQASRTQPRYQPPGPGLGPAIGLAECPPGDGRPYSVWSTAGMSAQRMPAVEQEFTDPRRHARIELAIAAAEPAPWIAPVLAFLGTYPWRAIAWFGPGHTIQLPAAIPQAPPGVMLADFSMLTTMPGPPPVNLAGFVFGNDPVRWLWALPVSERDRQLAKTWGAASLLQRLQRPGGSWITIPETMSKGGGRP